MENSMNLRKEGEKVSKITAYADKVCVLLASGNWATLSSDEDLLVPIPFSHLVEDSMHFKLLLI